MKMHERYFLASGATEAAVRQLFEDRGTAKTKALIMLEEQGFPESGLYLWSALGPEKVVAADPVDPLPEGFRLSRDEALDGKAVPDLRTTKGKAVHRAWDELVIPGVWNLPEYTGTPFRYVRHDARYVPPLAAQELGDKVVVTVRFPGDPDDISDHEEAAWVPVDCAELKRSEYYALVEAAEEGGS